MSTTYPPTTQLIHTALQSFLCILQHRCSLSIYTESRLIPHDDVCPQRTSPAGGQQQFRAVAMSVGSTCVPTCWDETLVLGTAEYRCTARHCTVEFGPSDDSKCTLFLNFISLSQLVAGRAAGGIGRESPHQLYQCLSSCHHSKCALEGLDMFCLLYEKHPLGWSVRVGDRERRGADRDVPTLEFLKCGAVSMDCCYTATDWSAARARSISTSTRRNRLTI